MITNRLLAHGGSAPRPWTESIAWRRVGVLVLVLDLAVTGAVVAHLGGAANLARAVTGGVDPIEYLGSTFNPAGCVSAPLSVGEDLFVVCGDWSAVTSPGGTTEVVSLYADGNPVIAEYGGALPRALAWHESITEVSKALGRPRRISDMYGSPTLVYMYEGEKYGSLELQFDNRNELVRINACIKH
jgi:hypothetical protein